MENQANQRDKDGDNSMDKISELPQPILHHVLSFLSQGDAVRTCVLSKSWRYLWCARPIIDLRERCFRRNKKLFLFVLDKTLQRYHDQKLSIQELNLEMSNVDSDSNSLLEKWIPKVIIANKGLKAFALTLSCRGSEYFDLPSTLLKAESLQILYLKGCKLSQISSADEVLLKRLQTLTLNDVHIAKETLETILSSSPLLENVSLFGCKGFKTIKVSKPHGLKDFVINDMKCFWQSRPEDPVSIEIDIPTIESIRVIDCWFRHRNYFLPHLTFLFLNRAVLSKQSFDFLSGKYLPCLEHLTLESCFLPQEFHLRLSGSVKKLYFINIMKYLKASIDAPNIVEFGYESEISQSSISFTTTSSDWKSKITVNAYADLDNDSALWFHKLSELLKEFGQSKITLKLHQCSREDNQRRIEDDPSSLFELVPEVISWEGRHEYEPVLKVKRLSLKGDYSFSSLPAFLNCLFRICRPECIEQYLFFGHDKTHKWREKVTELTEFLMEMFVIMEKDMSRYFWPRGLEDANMTEAFDKHAQRFNGMKACFNLEWEKVKLP